MRARFPGQAEPEDLNRYSYVRNNPVNHTDPTGHYCIVAGPRKGECIEAGEDAGDSGVPGNGDSSSGVGSAAAGAAAAAAAAVSGVSQDIVDYIRQSYRPGQNVLPGGVAGALEFELDYGVKLSKAGHYLKALDRLPQVEKMLADAKIRGGLSQRELKLLQREAGVLRQQIARADAMAARLGVSARKLFVDFDRVDVREFVKSNPGSMRGAPNSVRATGQRFGGGFLNSAMFGAMVIEGVRCFETGVGCGANLFDIDPAGLHEVA